MGFINPIPTCTHHGMMEGCKTIMLSSVLPRQRIDRELIILRPLLLKWVVNSSQTIWQTMSHEWHFPAGNFCSQHCRTSIRTQHSRPFHVDSGLEMTSTLDAASSMQHSPRQSIMLSTHPCYTDIRKSRKPPGFLFKSKKFKR